MRKVLILFLAIALGICALGYTYRETETDAECIARMLWGECRGVETTAEKAACVWVVLNRVDDARYPDTIQDVIRQPHQFHGYSRSNPVDPGLLAIAEDVLARWRAEPSCIGEIGRVLPANMLFFYGDGQRNHFYGYDEDGSRVRWDVSGEADVYAGNQEQ